MSCEYLFEVVVGDTLSIPILIADPRTGTKYNLTGCTVYFDVRLKGGTGFVIQKQVTSHTDPVNGSTRIDINATTMDGLSADSLYEFGVKVKDPSVTLDGGAYEFSVEFDSPYFKAIKKRTQE